MIHRKITNVNKTALTLFKVVFLYLPTIIDSYSICLFPCKIEMNGGVLMAVDKGYQPGIGPCYDINAA